MDDHLCEFGPNHSGPISLEMCDYWSGDPEGEPCNQPATFWFLADHGFVSSAIVCRCKLHAARSILSWDNITSAPLSRAEAEIAMVMSE